MTAFPPDLAVHDLPHLGVLFKRMREARGLSQTDIAHALNVSSSTISKLESTGRSRRDRIVERYIRALQSPSLNGMQLHCPLDQDAAALLHRLAAEAQNARGHELDIQLSAYDFSLISSPTAPPSLKTLVQRLRQCRWPAFICDGLWFVHAVNGALLDLFGIAPDSPLLRKWESWHMIASKFIEPSPVRQAHISPNNYFPPTIWAFFRATARYLFTPQMRLLLRELHYLSAANGLHFSQWWYSASSFTLYFDASQSVRILRRGDRYFHVSITEPELQAVPITAQMSVPYFLGIWQPLGAETESAFRQLNGAPPGELFFAVDYDAGRAFHVNSWPEIVREVTS